MIELTDKNFDEELAKNEVIVVKFWATWCGPCKLMEPVITDLATEFQGRIRFAKLDVDENPRVVQKYNVFSIPTLLVFSNNVLVDTIIGAQSKAVVQAKLESFAKKIDTAPVDKKLVRVYMEHDDGSVKFIEGKNLELWEQANAGVATNAFIRYGATGYENVVWEDLKSPVTLNPKQ